MHLIPGGLVLHECGDVSVVQAMGPKASELIGIHLLNPEPWELERALETAHRDGFERVVIHTAFTWPKAVRS